MRLNEMTVRALRLALDAGECTPGEVLASCIAHIEEDAKRSDTLNAFIEFWPDEARLAAAAQDTCGGFVRGIAAGERAPLLGIPFAYKDNLHYKGHALSCASRAAGGYRAAYTAHSLGRLLGAGALCVGRTNMDEFAVGSTGESSAFGPARNPRDRRLSPGGSSSGSAAAVAAGFVPFALGSDTGGSVRQPASFCGIVGMKPSYGRISRHGLVPGAASLDHIGIFTRSVEDAALVLSELAGYDPNDPGSIDCAAADYSEGLAGELAGIRIGLPKEYFAYAGMDAEVSAGLGAAIERLARAGADLREVSLPHFKYAAAVYSAVSGAEGRLALGSVDGIRIGKQGEEAGDPPEPCGKNPSGGLGIAVKRRILLGALLQSAGYRGMYLQKALQARRLIAQDFACAFAEADILLTPTSPTAAFPLGDKPSHLAANADIFTLSANLAGLPALSLPCACTSAGLPVGMQLMAPRLEDHRLLRAAYRAEKALGLPVRIAE